MAKMLAPAGLYHFTREIAPREGKPIARGTLARVLAYFKANGDPTGGARVELPDGRQFRMLMADLEDGPGDVKAAVIAAEPAAALLVDPYQPRGGARFCVADSPNLTAGSPICVLGTGTTAPAAWAAALAYVYARAAARLV